MGREQLPNKSKLPSSEHKVDHKLRKMMLHFLSILYGLKGQEQTNGVGAGLDVT